MQTSPQERAAPVENAVDSLPSRAPELDGLRGLLALWVVISHLFCWCGFALFVPPWPLTHYWETFVFAGPAVETFIILSGFVITFLLEKRPVTYRHFLTARFFRIFPIYAICLIAAIASEALLPTIMETARWRETVYFDWARLHWDNSHAQMSAHLFWHALMLHGAVPTSILPDSAATFLPPAWSLSLEWQYYLVAPLIAIVVRSATGIVCLCGVAWFVGRYASLWANAFLPMQLPLFLIGIGSYYIFAALLRRKDLGAAQRAIAPAVLVGVALVTRWHTVTLIVWSIGLCSLLLARCAHIPRGFLGIRQLLLHRWCQYLGHISYPLYLAHWPLILGLLYVVLKTAPGIAGSRALIALLVVGLPVILFCSTLLHRFVEQPGIAVGKKLTSPPPQEAPS